MDTLKIYYGHALKLLAATLIMISSSGLFAQDEVKDEKNGENQTEQIASEDKKGEKADIENSLELESPKESAPEGKKEAKEESGSEKISAKQKSENTTIQVIGEEETRERTIPDGPILKTPHMVSSYEVSYQQENIFHTTTINIMYGIVSGGLIGAIGGLSEYNSNNKEASNDRLAAYGSIGSGFGAFIGISVTVFSQFSNLSSYEIGYPLFEYSWYGTLSGALIGLAAGAIPYASSNDNDDLINYAGYGSVGGFVCGLVYFVFSKPYKSKPLNAKLDISLHPEQTSLTMNFKF